MPKINTIKRKKFALYFGNYINEEDVWIVFFVINNFNELDEATTWMEKYFNEKSKRTGKPANFTTINKRAMLAIQVYFDSKYYPLFPEMFDYFNKEHQVFSRKTGKLENEEKEPVVPLASIFSYKGNNVTTISHGDVNFPQYLFEGTIQRNVIAFEKFLSEAADVIFNFMETNSSSVEMGLYLNKNTFPKTIIITPTRNTIERKSIGEFSKKLILELKPDYLNGDEKYSRISLSMGIVKNSPSANTSLFYTYLWPYELNGYIKKRMEALGEDIHYKKESVGASFTSGFWSIYLKVIKSHRNIHLINSKLPNERVDSFLSDIKDNNLKKENISNSNKMLSLVFGDEFIRKQCLLFGTKINSMIFSNINGEKVNEQTGLFILFSYVFELLFGVRFLKTLLVEKDIYFYLKGKRKVYIQPEEFRNKDTIMKENLQTIFQDKFSPYSIAYMKGKSVFDAIFPHKCSTFYLKLDIKDFFGTINTKELTRLLLAENVGKKECDEIISRVKEPGGGLKQGMILSPILSNIYMDDFDAQIISRLNSYTAFKVAYTRYSDDMLISFEFKPNKEVVDNIVEFISAILIEKNMILNAKKERRVDDRIHFLGLTVGSGEIKVSRRKNKMIQKLKSSKNGELNDRDAGKLAYYEFILKKINEKVGCNEE